MLLMVFSVGSDRYALPAAKLREVVPMLVLKRLPPAPQFIAGLMNYRGTAVPVIDLCRVLIRAAAPRLLSTRILVLDHVRDGSVQGAVGLICAGATGLARKSPEEFVEAEVHLAGAPWLGKIAIDATGIIQLVEPEWLITPEVAALLYPEAGGA